MNESPDELRRRIEMLEDRSARTPTGARHGLIATVDDAGQPQDLVTVGVASGEHEVMAAWPDGPRLVAHFQDLREPLRVADLPAYCRGARLLDGVDVVEDDAVRDCGQRCRQLPTDR